MKVGNVRLHWEGLEAHDILCFTIKLALKSGHAERDTEEINGICCPRNISTIRCPSATTVSQR